MARAVLPKANPAAPASQGCGVKWCWGWGQVRWSGRGFARIVPNLRATLTYTRKRRALNFPHSPLYSHRLVQLRQTVLNTDSAFLLSQCQQSHAQFAGHPENYACLFKPTRYNSTRLGRKAPTKPLSPFARGQIRTVGKAQHLGPLPNRSRVKQFQLPSRGCCVLRCRQVRAGVLDSVGATDSQFSSTWPASKANPYFHQ